MTHISSEELSTMQRWFERLSNTIVAASEFAAKVEALSSEVDALKADIDNYRAENERLDRELHEVRRQRDEAQEQHKQVSAILSTNETELLRTGQALDKARGELDSTNRSLAEARRERDDAQFRVLELTERAERAEATLKKFRDMLGDNASPPTTATVIAESGPTTDYKPASEMKRVYEKEDGVTFGNLVNTHKMTWDVSRQDYYVEVAA